METQTKASARDFFINLGAIIALGTVIGNLVSLLFTIINKAYPVTTGYNYYGTYSISFPVASLIVFFPIYILLMWLLEKGYLVEPEKRNVGIRKWLTYITLFLAGLAFAIDLIYVIYYFIDGQEMTTGFILKAITVLVISLGVFFYYISDVRGKLNSMSRKVWAVISLIIILGSIVWGFSVLGSPRTQQLIKYDEQKVNDLVNINYSVQNYYQIHGTLPLALAAISPGNYPLYQDKQTGKSYEYEYVDKTTYKLCAEFNKDSYGTEMNKPYYPENLWNHPAGHYCFEQTINPNTYSNYPKPVPYESR